MHIISASVFLDIVPVIDDTFPIDQSGDLLILSFLPYLLVGMSLERETSHLFNFPVIPFTKENQDMCLIVFLLFTNFQNNELVH